MLYSRVLVHWLKVKVIKVLLGLSYIKDTILESQCINVSLIGLVASLVTLDMAKSCMHPYTTMTGVGA